jgi:hypothetical protein
LHLLLLAGIIRPSFTDVGTCSRETILFKKFLSHSLRV